MMGAAGEDAVARLDLLNIGADRLNHASTQIADIGSRSSKIANDFAGRADRGDFVAYQYLTGSRRGDG